MQFKENFLENLKNETEKKTEQAVLNAFDIEKNQKAFLQNTLSEEELLRKFWKAVIEVKTLSEFRIILEKLKDLKIFQGFDTKEVQKSIAHENSHGNKAEELGGFHESFQVVLLRNSEKDYSKSFFTTVTSFPVEWEEKRKIETQIKILEAPKAYGDDEMSASDLKMVNELLRKKFDLLIKEKISIDNK